MAQLDDLYSFADDQGIAVDYCLMRRAESISAPLPDGSCAVAIDPTKLKSTSDELMKLAHEIGHCETGSFYNQYAKCDVVKKHENRADRWAIEKLVPKDKLEIKMKEGVVKIWELSEEFDVSEEFMRKAVQYYGLESFI